MNSDLTQLLFDETPDALIGLSAEGQFVFWNRGAEEVVAFQQGFGGVPQDATIFGCSGPSFMGF